MRSTQVRFINQRERENGDTNLKNERMKGERRLDGATTFRIMTLSITTLSIMTLSIMTF